MNIRNFEIARTPEYQLGGSPELGVPYVHYPLSVVKGVLTNPELGIIHEGESLDNRFFSFEALQAISPDVGEVLKEYMQHNETEFGGQITWNEGIKVHKVVKPDGDKSNSTDFILTVGGNSMADVSESTIENSRNNITTRWSLRQEGVFLTDIAIWFDDQKDPYSLNKKINGVVRNDIEFPILRAYARAKEILTPKDGQREVADVNSQSYRRAERIYQICKFIFDGYDYHKGRAPKKKIDIEEEVASFQAALYETV